MASNKEIIELKELDAAQRQTIRDLQYEAERLEMEVDLHNKDLNMVKEYNSNNEAVLYNSTVATQQLEAAANEKAKIIAMENESAQSLAQQRENYRVEKSQEMADFTKNVDELSTLFLNAPSHYGPAALSAKLENVLEMQTAVKNELKGIALDLAAMKDKFSLDLPISNKELTELRNELSKEELKNNEEASIMKQLKQDLETYEKMSDILKRDITQMKNYQH